jgi:hypothetical protein
VNGIAGAERAVVDPVSGHRHRSRRWRVRARPRP